MNKKKFKIKMLENDDNFISVSEALKITRVTLSKKLNQKTDFLSSEILILKEKWNLKPEEVDEIFFDKVVS